MTDRTTAHATFTVVRDYKARPGRVWTAFADLDQKRRWFGGPDAGHTMDFRVGGEEICDGVHEGARYHTRVEYLDIVPERRIVHAYTMDMSRPGETSARRISASLQTLEFEAADGGCRLTLTEQGVFLDGLDTVAQREHGTRWLLDQIAPLVEG